MLLRWGGQSAQDTRTDNIEHREEEKDDEEEVHDTVVAVHAAAES